MPKEPFFSSLDLPENFGLSLPSWQEKPNPKPERSEEEADPGYPKDVSPPPTAFVVWCSASLIIFLAQQSPDFANYANADTTSWEALRKDTEQLEKLYSLFMEKPIEISPEVKFLHIFLQSLPKEKVTLHFITDTSPASELAKVFLERYYGEQGYEVFLSTYIPLYYRTPISRENSTSDWEPLRELAWLDELLYTGNSMRSDRKTTYFCAFGKNPIPYVLCAVAAYITGSIFFYMDPETGRKLLFPYNFYIGKGDEWKLLNNLAMYKLYPESYPPVHRRFMNDRPWDRLLLYNLIRTEKDRITQKVTTRITHRGWFYVG